MAVNTMHHTFLYNIPYTLCYAVMIYCNDPKFLHRQVWENSVDPDQTASKGAV